MKNLFPIIVVFNLAQTLGQYSISAGINAERFLPSVGMTNSPLGIKKERLLPSVGMTISPYGRMDKRFLLAVGMTNSPLGIKDKTMAAKPPLFYPPLFRTSPSFRLQGGIPITAETEVIPTSSAERNPNHRRNKGHRTTGRISTHEKQKNYE